MFDVGRELEGACYSEFVPSFDQLSIESRSVLGALLDYSSVSRDVLDLASGVALYTSTNPGDQLWWTTEDEDSAKETQYIADWRGFVKCLINNHVPFDVVTVPHADAATLARYRLLVAPSLASLSTGAVESVTLERLVLFDRGYAGVPEPVAAGCCLRTHGSFAFRDVDSPQQRAEPAA